VKKLDKTKFQNEIDSIEVPTIDVLTAIDRGIELGKKDSEIKRGFPFKKASFYLTVAASLLLISGVFLSPVTNALAKIPVIGNIFEKLDFELGENLAESGLIKEFNQKATSNGIDVTITNAFFEEDYLMFTFRADGENLPELMDIKEGPESGYGWYEGAADDDKYAHWSAQASRFIKDGNGYIARIEFTRPNIEVKENYSLPITFHYILGVQGKWKFDIPIKQILSKQVLIKGESILNNGDYTLEFDKMTKGHASTYLYYRLSVPKIGENDDLEIDVLDNNNKRWSKDGAEVISIVEKDDKIEISYRYRFNGKLDPSTTQILVKPTISQSARDVIVKPIDSVTPIIAIDQRFGGKIEITNFSLQGKKLNVEYQIIPGNKKTVKMSSLENNIKYIQLIKNSDLVKDSNGDFDFNRPMTFLLAETATLIDKNNLCFNAIYSIESPESFKLEDYSLKWDVISFFDTQVKMDPITIDLK
jgi:hypothetical protein